MKTIEEIRRSLTASWMIFEKGGLENIIRDMKEDPECDILKGE